MAKGIDKKYAAGRLDGLAWALRIAEKDGIEGLKHEVKFRHALPVQFELDREFAVKLLDENLHRAFATQTTMLYKALHEEFGFGKERLQRIEKKVLKDSQEVSETDPYGYRYLTFNDIAKEYNELYGLHIDEDATIESDELNTRSMPIYRASIPAIHELMIQNKHFDAAKTIKEWFPEAFNEVIKDA